MFPIILVAVEKLYFKSLRVIVYIFEKQKTLAKPGFLLSLFFGRSNQTNSL